MPEQQQAVTTTKPQEDVNDPLAQLLADIDKDAKRVLACDDVEAVREYVGRTVMPTVRDLGKQMLQIRDWAAHAHFRHADHLDNHEERIGYVEAATFDSGSEQLSQESWETFQRIAIALELFATESLKTTTDPEGRKQLEEQQKMAKGALTMLNEIAILDDDDDDADDADGDQQQ